MKAADFRQLTYFLAAADCRSFRRAAQSLRVQQSAVSKRVRDLEHRVGVALFIWAPSGVELTGAGKYFAEQVRKMLTQLDTSIAFARAMGSGELGVIHIGLSSSLASEFLANLIRTHASREPGVRLNYVEASPGGHFAAIQRRELDIAFVIGRPTISGCEIAYLWDERFFVALPCGHELEEAKEITWSDLRGRNFIVSAMDPAPEIHDYLIRHLSDLGCRLSVECCGVHRDNLMQLVALGQGLTLTSEATTAIQFAGVIYRPLVASPLPFSAVWSTSNENPALRPFLDLAQAIAEEKLDPKTL
ncbi:LysR family transcriptional regulator [Oleomonas cavernae]|uniref:LysR family transcriptional regulator n=1 Tax=Oleomonas cavernae TaxID=2320859 RepID=A0A418WH33_9PROT|nr:LysR family transcriptional regulator [Oleomonas cavernae]RJF89300.1 LysR family transcriptional regulator [Oleomonas cavernae]